MSAADGGRTDERLESKRSCEQPARAKVAQWRARLHEPVAHATGRFRDICGDSKDPPSTRRSTCGDESDARCPVSIPTPAAIHPTGYRGTPLDDAPVRRLRDARGTPMSATSILLAHGQTGLSVAFDFPTLDGLRLRPPALGGRSRQVRRRDLEPRRHGDAVRRHSARQGLHLDDDQRSRGHPLLRSIIAAAEKQGVAIAEAARHDSERHPQGVSWRSTRGSIPSSRR